VKKGYKTEKGLLNIISNMTVKMMKKDWLKTLGRENDFSAAMKLFTRLMKGTIART
jgi:mannitol/fructose-specific phosphotransferase system IIA component (Ntr-type)